MRKIYAIKITTRLLPPRYLAGYNTRAEAEIALNEMEREPECYYSVVYVTEYFNGAMDRNGNYTLSTIAEIQE